MQFIDQDDASDAYDETYKQKLIFDFILSLINELAVAKTVVNEMER